MQVSFSLSPFFFFFLVGCARSAKSLWARQIKLSFLDWRAPALFFKRTKKAFLLLFAAFALAALSGCGQSLQYKVAQDELQTKLSQAFPLQAALPPIVDLHLSAPRLTLLPEQNRLQTQIQLSLLSPLISPKNPVNGNLSIDYSLGYRPEDGSILLKQVRVRALSLDKVQPKWIEQALGAAINGWLQEASLDIALYTLPKEELQKIQALGVKKVVFQVLPDSVQITINPES